MVLRMENWCERWKFPRIGSTQLKVKVQGSSERSLDAKDAAASARFYASLDILFNNFSTSARVSFYSFSSHGAAAPPAQPEVLIKGVSSLFKFSVTPHEAPPSQGALHQLKSTFS